MSNQQSHNQEQIFARMFRELRAWNPDISASPERLDPILSILLKLYSSQLAQIDQRVDRLWDVATNVLIRSVCPDSGRWPIPAHAVMHCELADPIVEVDSHTSFFFKEQREGGRSFFFHATS